jgi:hypothetical protein
VFALLSAGCGARGEVQASAPIQPLLVELAHPEPIEPEREAAPRVETLAPAPAPPASSSEAVVLSESSSPSEPPAEPIPPGTAVVHIGDSFTFAGFSQALRPRMKALGVRYEVHAETSAYTPTWAAKIGRLVANTQPDLVIITLGANEVGTPIPEAHAPAVRRLVQEIGGRPCVWVSPPLWLKDRRMIDVIREHSAPCRFFDSDKLVDAPIRRQKDKIHPTPEGGAIWADAFWRWLEAERVGGVDARGRPRPWALRPAPPGEHGPAP